MKHLAPAIVCASLSVAAAWADADTSHQKKIYAEINAKQEEMRKVQAASESAGKKVKLDGYFDGAGLRKIVAVTGGSTEEIYLEAGEPIFVFSVVRDGGKKAESRLYFGDGEIVKWIDSDPSFVPHAEDCEAMAKKVRRDAKVFGQALSTASPKSVKVFEGVFSGIEEGDYAHWNMRGANGEARSFFVFSDVGGLGAVLENPTQFEGKRCRVRWERRNQNIPEAGGTVDVDAVLGVEWL